MEMDRKLSDGTKKSRKGHRAMQKGFSDEEKEKDFYKPGMNESSSTFVNYAFINLIMYCVNFNNDFLKTCFFKIFSKFCDSKFSGNVNRNNICTLH